MTDKDMAYPPGLTLHGKSWRITKRTPSDLLPHYSGKKHLHHNTGKTDKREAAPVAWQWLGEQATEFERLRTTGRRERTSIATADVQWLVDSMLSSTLGAGDEDLMDGATPARLSLEAFESLKEAARLAFSEGDFSRVSPIAVVGCCRGLHRQG